VWSTTTVIWADSTVQDVQVGVQLTIDNDTLETVSAREF
jgi:hypothetical protein